MNRFLFTSYWTIGVVAFGFFAFWIIRNYKKITSSAGDEKLLKLVRVLRYGALAATMIWLSIPAIEAMREGGLETIGLIYYIPLVGISVVWFFLPWERVLKIGPIVMITIITIMFMFYLYLFTSLERVLFGENFKF